MTGGATMDPGFGLYVHWPFCRSKCPYCDFNSHVREYVDQDRWHAALLREMAHYAALTEGRGLNSIFFGGGTPSLMPPETVAAVIEQARRFWPTKEDGVGLDGVLEITMEANPTSSEAGNFAAYADAGVNRVSLGVQALDDAALAFLGRQHSKNEALSAVGLARQHFPRFSFDLIYARPGQSPESWAAELSAALKEAPGHISLYQLTIEEGTAFHAARRRGELVELDEDAAAEMFEATRARLSTAGLPAYEVSNHAAPGQECRHNLIYWRYGDYLGIGPGAHGRLTLEGCKYATRQHRAPEVWLSTVEKDGHATRSCEPLSRKTQCLETVMLGLRLPEGVSTVRIESMMERAVEDLFGDERLSRLQSEGLLERTEAHLRVTAAGMLRLDGVLRYLLEDLGNES